MSMRTQGMGLLGCGYASQMLVMPMVTTCSQAYWLLAMPHCYSPLSAPFRGSKATCGGRDMLCCSGSPLPPLLTGASLIGLLDGACISASQVEMGGMRPVVGQLDGALAGLNALQMQVNHGNIAIATQQPCIHVLCMPN